MPISVLRKVCLIFIRICGFFTLGFIFACNTTSTTNIEKLIAHKIEDCKESNCDIRLTDVTDFKWDKVYVFGAESTEEGYIDKAIGTHYQDYQEFSRHFIFMLNNKVVYSENAENNIEGVIDGQVIFMHPDSIQAVYTPHNCIFKATTRTSGDKTYYELTLKQ